MRNGTSWSEVAEMGTARQASASAGTQSAGLVAMGYKIGATASEVEFVGSKIASGKFDASHSEH